MQIVGKHLYTAKCGISLIKNVWFKVVEDSDLKYVFLLARNPYNRLGVSMLKNSLM